MKKLLIFCLGLFLINLISASTNITDNYINTTGSIYGNNLYQNDLGVLDTGDESNLNVNSSEYWNGTKSFNSSELEIQSDDNLGIIDSFINSLIDNRVTQAFVKALGFSNSTEVTTEIENANTSLKDYTDNNFANLNTDNTFNGNLIVNGNFSLIGSYLNATVTNQYLNGSFLPSINNQFDIGSSSFKWKDGYFNKLYSNDWTNISITESQISDLQIYLTSETDPLWTANQSSYSTTAEIIAFGYYNSSDFDINNYVTSATLDGYNYYNASDFSISDYFTSAEVLGFNYYNSTDFSISDYYTKSDIEGFNYYNLTDFDINDYATNVKVDSLGNWSADKGDYYTSGQVDTALAGQDECSEITGCVEGAISSESDPLWTANQSSYYTSAQTDTEIENANTSMKGYVDGLNGTWDADTLDGQDGAYYLDNTDDQTCAEVSGCVENAITDGNTNWDNSYGFWNDTYATFNKTYADTLYADISVVDTNETTRFNNLVGNCSEGQQVFGIDSSGNKVCVTDSGGTENPFDQSLNTTDHVEFAGVNVSGGNLYLGGYDYWFNNGDNSIWFYDDSNPTAERIYFDEFVDIFYFTSVISVPAIMSEGDIYTKGSGDDFWLGDSIQASANFRAYATGELHIDSDNMPLSLGEGQDADIYYNGANLVINPKVVGSGRLDVLGNGNFTNNVSADYFIGDGSQLTGISVTETDPLWTANQSSYSTTADIIAFGYYNSSDFDINDYALQSSLSSYFNSIENFTGTLTNGKICTYNSGTGEIDCNTDDSDTTYTAGSNLTLDGTEFNVDVASLKTYFDTIYQTIGSYLTSAVELLTSNSDYVTLNDSSGSVLVDFNETKLNATIDARDSDTNLTEDDVESYIFDEDNTANLGMNNYNVTNVSYQTFCNGANCWKQYVNASGYFIIEEI